ncbi:MAG TPA: STAS domain-containing protein [Puia sp.]|jgi:rsbT co-antagonist protein RsbR|nr:STAS domain-containing protein [Puia sp.]
MAFDIYAVLQKKKQQILERWINHQLANDSLRDELISNEDTRVQSEELLDAFLNKLRTEAHGGSVDADEDAVAEIIESITISRARKGYSPRETGVFLFSFKEAVLKALNEEAKDDPAKLYEESLNISTKIDALAIDTFETFIKGREEIILRQTDEIAEISTPVIRVWEGILAMPIIGTLDSSRTQVIMESLLSQIVETGSGITILDISGVPAVDSLVAQHLIKTVSATRLMGAECIISGIRPEIAQTIVHLGIDLSGIITKASLASALRYAFGVLRMEVKKINKEGKA